MPAWRRCRRTPSASAATLPRTKGALRGFCAFSPCFRPRWGCTPAWATTTANCPALRGRFSPHARLLVNESVFLEGLRLGGVDERKHGHPRPEAVFPHDGASARVLLAHYPVVCDFGAGARPDLQLSGHTHGGQFNMLGISPYTFFFRALQPRLDQRRMHAGRGADDRIERHRHEPGDAARGRAAAGALHTVSQNKRSERPFRHVIPSRKGRFRFAASCR